MRNLHKTTERKSQIEHGGKNEGDRAEQNKPQRYAARERTVTTRERAKKIEANNHDRDDQQEISDRTQSRNPHGDRRADQSAATRQRGHDHQPPESERRQIIISNRLPENFRQEIISRGQRHGDKPETVETVHVPGIDDGLQHAAHRSFEQHQLGNGI